MGVLFLNLLSCPYLLGAQAVLVMVVCGYTVGAECCIAVAFPTAAQINGVIYAAYAVSTADGDTYGIVFAITHIRESYLAYYGSVEGTWSTQAIDAQRIVHAILGSPLTMVYDAWGQCLQVKVAQAVTAYYHGASLLTEGVNDALQCVLVAIEVITIKLYGIAATLVVTYGEIPAATDAQVVTLGGDH